MKNSKVKPGQYQHFKGDLVEVIGTSLHSETGEEFVTYKHLTGAHAGETHYWVRPIEMFMEEVVVEGKTVPRFKFLGTRR